MTNAALADESGITLSPRYEIYRTPHKSLRSLLCHLLIEMGRTSFGNEAQARLVTDAMEVVLVQCDEHIHHEDAFIRPALVARTPRAIATLDEEHEEHATQVAELRAMAKALGDAENDAHRSSIGRTLYLHFSVFVAETLAHMAYEERVVQPLLDRYFSYEDQLGIERSIVGSISPAGMMEFLQSAIPASSREERFEVLAGARVSMPSPAFAALLDELLPLLSESDQDDLRSRLAA